MSFRASGFRGFGTLPVEFMRAIEAVLSVAFLLTA